MQTVDEKPETIHLYVVREEEKKPSPLLPLLFAVLCLVAMVAITVYSSDHPYYEHITIRVPAIFLPIQHFTTEQTIIPTGTKYYPATAAHGLLTVYNGSILSQELPQGMILSAKSGVEVITDQIVYVPAGNPPYFGIASVPSHAAVAGTRGNIPSYALNEVYGTSLYIRNQTAFTGGKNSYSVKVETPQDRQTALDAARVFLASQKAKITAFPAYPCNESSHEKNSLLWLSWMCQFVTYTIPSYMSVTHVKLVGKNLYVDVRFVARPKMSIFK